MLKIVVFCSDLHQFDLQKKQLMSLEYVPAQIIHADSTKKSREVLINENLGSWLLFLDHDCELTKESKKEIERLAQSTNPIPLVFAGSYQNPFAATALQRAHNLIANGWLGQSYSASAEQAFVLGGIFLIQALVEIPAPEVQFWGAEDKLLAYHLKKAGYAFSFCENLTVIHNTNTSFRHFVNRALQHGRNDVIYFKPSAPVSFSYWIRKIDFADLSSAFLILLHFCIQKAAKLAQRVLLPNKQRS